MFLQSVCQETVCTGGSQIKDYPPSALHRLQEEVKIWKNGGEAGTVNQINDEPAPDTREDCFYLVLISSRSCLRDVSEGSHKYSCTNVCVWTQFAEPLLEAVSVAALPWNLYVGRNIHLNKSFLPVWSVCIFLELREKSCLRNGLWAGHLWSVIAAFHETGWADMSS